ncbi:hypothetical protein [Chryseolinea lacunae]|uniref:Type IX secretion system membrane protein PorP/SprF n=1 Tax=Chryseolinea lacunae TaxID=2801331 RepID=A0ABS1KYZ2_9BACT|nr:hypothetical protein [Chryseolinea lacunae]MBL0744447.1 hypothetical protein [Chryseolinea lacunae]
MKRKILFSVLFVTPAWLSAQHVVVSPMVEKTINNYQYGGSISLEVQSQWRFGVFYQTSLSRLEQTRPHDQFWGMTVSAPLMKADRITFYGNSRVGFVNKYFLVLCPAVATELKLLKRFHLNVAISIRKGYLSAQTSMNIKI